MTNLNAHLARMKKLQQVRNAPALKSVATASAIEAHLTGEVDAAFIKGCDTGSIYREAIMGANLTVSNDDVMARLDVISTGSAIDNILEPVFLQPARRHNARLQYRHPTRCYPVPPVPGVPGVQLRSARKKCLYAG